MICHFILVPHMDEVKAECLDSRLPERYDVRPGRAVGTSHLLSEIAEDVHPMSMVCDCGLPKGENLYPKPQDPTP